MIEETIKIKSRYVMTIAEIETDEQKELNARIEALRSEKKPFMELVRKLNSICKTRQLIFENIVCTAGKTVLTNNLTSASPTHPLKITHAALGSNSTPPAAGDTQLGTETYRNAVASLASATNVAYATAFYSAAETSGTFAEVGFFIDGAAGANTGQLWSHALASFIKTTLQTYTVDASWTFN
jgi:hypothetical protein